MEPEIPAPGEVLISYDDVGEIPAGQWVVVEVGFMATLSRLGEDEDGQLCTTARIVRVTLPELLQQFRRLGMTISEPL